MNSPLPAKFLRLWSLLAVTALLAFGAPRESVASPNPYLDAVQAVLDPTPTVPLDQSKQVWNVSLAQLESALQTVLTPAANKANASLYLAAVLSVRQFPDADAQVLLPLVPGYIAATPTLAQISSVTAGAISVTSSTTWATLVNQGITLSGTSLSGTSSKTAFTAGIVTGLTNIQTISSVVQSAYQLTGSSSFVSGSSFALSVANNAAVKAKATALAGAIIGGESLVGGTAAQVAFANNAIKTLEPATGNQLAYNIALNVSQFAPGAIDTIITGIVTNGTSGWSDPVGLELLKGAAQILPTSDATLNTIFQQVVGRTAASKTAAPATLSSILALRSAHDTEAANLLTAAINGVGSTSAPTLAMISTLTGTALSFTSGTATISSVINSATAFSPVTSGSAAKVAFTASILSGITNQSIASTILQDAFTSGASGGIAADAFTLAVGNNAAVKANATRLLGTILGGEALVTGTAAQVALANSAIKTLEPTTGNLLAYNIALNIAQFAPAAVDTVITGIVTNGTSGWSDAVGLELLKGAAQILPISDATLNTVFQKVVGQTTASKTAAAKTLSTILALRSAHDTEAAGLLTAAVNGVGGTSASLAMISTLTGTALSFTSGTATIASVINSATAFSPVTSGSAAKVAFTASILSGITNQNTASTILQDAFTSGASGGIAADAFTLAVGNNAAVKANATRLLGTIIGGEGLLTGTTAQIALANSAIAAFEPATGNQLAFNIISNIAQFAAPANFDSIILGMITPARTDAVNLELLKGAATVLPATSLDGTLAFVLNRMVGLTTTSKANAAKTLSTVLAIRPLTRDADAADLLNAVIDALGGRTVSLTTLSQVTGAALTATSTTAIQSIINATTSLAQVSGTNKAQFTANLVALVTGSGTALQNSVSSLVQTVYQSGSSTVAADAFTLAVANNTAVKSNTSRLLGTIIGGESLVTGTTAQIALANSAIAAFEPATGNQLAFNIISNIAQFAAPANFDSIILGMITPARTDAVNLELLKGAATVLPATSLDGTLAFVLNRMVGLTTTSKANAAKTLSTVLAIRPLTRDADAADLLNAVIDALGGRTVSLTTLSQVTGAALAATGTSAVQSVINATASLAQVTGSTKTLFTTNVLNGLTNIATVSLVVQDVFNSGSAGLPAGDTASTFALRVATSVKTNANLAAGAITGGIALLSGSDQTNLARQAITLLNASSPGNAFSYNLALYSTPLLGTSGTSFIATISNGQTEVVKYQIVKGAVQSAASTTADAAGAYVTAVLSVTGTGVNAIKNYAAFASSAISGAPTNTNIAEEVAELVAKAPAISSGTAQIAFAKSLAILQPALAASIATGVVDANPAIVAQVTGQVIISSATTIKNAASIAAIMTTGYDISAGSYIAAEIGKGFAANPTLAVQAPQISASMTAVLYALPLDTSAPSQDKKAQEIAATAFAFVNALSGPGTLITAANQKMIAAIVSNLNLLMTTTGADATFRHNMSLDFYAAIANSYFAKNQAFVASIANAFSALLPTEIAKANGGAYPYGTGTYGPLTFVETPIQPK